MTTGNSSLIYTSRPPQIQLHSKAPALILLHGRGADENDLMGLAEYFDERLYVISVRAPYQWMHGPGFTWFEIEDIGSPDPAMFAESYAKLIRFLHDVPKFFPVDHTKIILCGFSMGAMMSYVVALHEPELVNGVMALSGLIPGSTIKSGYELDKLEKKHFFIAHGVHDSVIPVSFGRKARDILTGASADVTYREYEMDHQISEETLNDMIKWIANLLEDKKKSEY
jgi:phospholipase/carboxylesterase